MMRVIFRGEEKRWRTKLEKEASLIHREAMSDIDDVEEKDKSVDMDEKLLEELLRTEEQEVLALLDAMEKADAEADAEMEDVTTSDIDLSEL